MATDSSRNEAPDAFKLGKVLAAQEKETRDKGIEILKGWLQNKTNPTELDYMKVWRALFYCMWMSDKPVVQHELAKTLASLLHVPPTPNATVLFIQAFLKTMVREWNGIDRFRLDKYLWLLRFFVNEYLRFLKEQDFDEELMDQLNFVFLTTALNPDSSQTFHGLVEHLSAVYLDEHTKVLGDEWWLQGSETLLTLFFPWLQLLASCDNGGVVHHLIDELFENIVSLYVQVKELASRATGDSKEAIKLRTSKHVFLDFMTSVDEAVLELAKDENTLDKNRKALYNLHSTFQLNLAETEKDSPTKRKEKNSSKKRERTSTTNDDTVPTVELKKSKRSETENGAALDAKKAKDDPKKSKEAAKKALELVKNKPAPTTSKAKKASQTDEDSDSSIDSDMDDLDDEDALAAIEDEFGSDFEGEEFSDDGFEDELDFDSDDDDEEIDFEDDAPVTSFKKNGKPVKGTPTKKDNFVKMTPSKQTPPRSSNKSPGSQKSPKSPKSPSSNGNKKVSFNGDSIELTKKHIAKVDSPTPKSILKPTPAGPVSANISDATSINSLTEFGGIDYQIPARQKVLAQPRKLTNADRKQLIKQTMLQAMGKKK